MPDYGRTPGNKFQASPPSSADLYGMRRSKIGNIKKHMISGRKISLRDTGNGYILVDGKTTGTMKDTLTFGRSYAQKGKSKSKLDRTSSTGGHMPSGTYSTREAYHLLH